MEEIYKQDDVFSPSDFSIIEIFEILNNPTTSKTEQNSFNLCLIKSFKTCKVIVEEINKIIVQNTITENVIKNNFYEELTLVSDSDQLSFLSDSIDVGKYIFKFENKYFFIDSNISIEKQINRSLEEDWTFQFSLDEIDRLKYEKNCIFLFNEINNNAETSEDDQQNTNLKNTSAEIYINSINSNKPVLIQNISFLNKNYDLLNPTVTEDSSNWLPLFLNPVEEKSDIFYFFVPWFSKTETLPIKIMAENKLIKKDAIDGENLINLKNLLGSDIYKKIEEIIYVTSTFLQNFENIGDNASLTSFKNLYGSNLKTATDNIVISTLNSSIYSNEQKSFFKATVLMLSKYIQSDYCWGGGLNKEIEVGLPFYFNLLGFPVKTRGDQLEFSLQSYWFDFIGSWNDDNSKINIKRKHDYLFNKTVLNVNDNAIDLPEFPEKLETQNVSNSPVNFNKTSYNLNYFCNLLINKETDFNIFDFWISENEIANSETYKTSFIYSDKRVSKGAPTEPKKKDLPKFIDNDKQRFIEQQISSNEKYKFYQSKGWLKFEITSVGDPYWYAVDSHWVPSGYGDNGYESVTYAPKIDLGVKVSWIIPETESTEKTEFNLKEFEEILYKKGILNKATLKVSTSSEFVKIILKGLFIENFYIETQIGKFEITPDKIDCQTTVKINC